MYRSIVLFFLLLFNFTLFAQQSHFVYIQTENKQTFYVKLNNTLYSSTASGYVIIPGLSDGDYTFNIGFPKSEFAEQPIYYNINRNDAGFLLKNFGEKGWGLFNLQTLEVVMAGEQKKTATVITEVKTDAFSTMLSDVIDDPGIKKTTKTVTVEEKNKDSLVVQPTVQQEVKPVQNQIAQNDSIVIPTPETVAVENRVEKKDSVVTSPAVAEPKQEYTTAEYIPSELVRVSSGNSEKGFVMLFVDKSKIYVDTVDVLIPEVEETMITDTSANLIKQEQLKDSLPVIEIVPAAIVQDTTKQDDQSQKEKSNTEAKTQFLDIELSNPNQTDSVSASQTKVLVDVTKQESNIQVPSSIVDSVQIKSPPVKIEKGCTEATDEDFFKLRKKMAAADAEFDMITVAKKSFKSKCFSVAQIKNLSVLFLNEAGKLRFFQEAYDSVSNKADFGELRSQLTDENYLKEFDTLIKK